MGIIRRQSIYSSVFTLLGFAIGAVNLLVLFKHFLTTEELALTRLLLDFSLPFATFCTLGSVPAVLKFYPFYKSYLPEKKNDLPLLSLLFTMAGIAVFLTFTIVFKDFVLRKFAAKSPLFLPYYDLIYPLTISIAVLNLGEAYAWSLKKTILSNFLKEVTFRILTLIIILLYIFRQVSIRQFFWLYSFTYTPAALILLFYLIKSGAIDLKFSISNLTRRLYKKIVAFSLFIYAGSILNMLSVTIAGIIISSQSTKGLKDTAAFTVAVYFISIMEVPQRSMTAITTPIIADAWKNRNITKIHELYQKTSLTLLVAGLLIWGISMVNMHNVIAYMGEDYIKLTKLVLILGLAKLIDLGTGMNSQIMLLSKHWKLDFVCNTIFVFSVIPLNYFLIRSYGVVGSAFATLIAQCLYNLLRFIFIWHFFRLQPFTPRTLIVVFIAMLTIAGCYFTPAITNIYIDTIVRTFLFSIVFISAILYFNVSEDVSSILQTLKQKAGIGR